METQITNRNVNTAQNITQRIETEFTKEIKMYFQKGYLIALCLKQIFGNFRNYVRVEHLLKSVPEKQEILILDWKISN